MKKVNIDSIEELEALNQNELVNLAGGESLWYWVAYAAGSVVRAVSEAFHDATERPQCQEILIA